jgi:hypothetical protein
VTRRQRLVGIALTAVVLGGCSLLGLAYRNADHLLVMAADRWFDLDRTQKRTLASAIRVRLAAHQRDELPVWTAGLRRLRADLARGPEAADIEWLFEESRRLWRDGFERSLPLVADLLAGLSAAQVEHFAAELAEANAEYAAELGADADRRAERLADLVRELERWTGRLDARQRAQLATLVGTVPDTARDWERYRLARQSALLASLRARRDAAGQIEMLRAWYLEDRHLDPALAEQWARNRATYAAGLAELLRSLDDKQRARLLARLDAVLEDLATMPTVEWRAAVDPPGRLFYNELVAP